MANISLIHEPHTLPSVLEASHTHPVIVFKHSSSCPFSAAGHKTVQQLAQELESQPTAPTTSATTIYMVVVQQSPELSRQIEEVLEVTHETPQAIVVHQGKASDVFNHAAIDAAAIIASL